MRQNIKKVHKHYFFMERGQISIDLLITLIIVIMVIGAFTIILNSFQTGQEEFFLRTQLRENSSTLASFITSTNAISDTNFTTQLMIHHVSYKNILKQPVVTIIDQNYLKLTINIGDDITITESSFFSKPNNSTVLLDGKLLVISNE